MTKIYAFYFLAKKNIRLSAENCTSGLLKKKYYKLFMVFNFGKILQKLKQCKHFFF